MKGSTWKWISITCIALIVLSYLGYVTIFPTAPTVTPPGVTPPGAHESGQIQLQVVNFIGRAGVTTATVTADFCQAENGVFDFLMQTDTMTHASNPDVYNVYYPEGAEIIIRVGCTGNPTNGLDYYDGWYYVKLVEGNPVYYITKAMLTATQTSPTYKYSISTSGAQTTGETVTWTSGTTHYWDIGKLSMYPRLSAANFDTALSNQTHDLASVTDGSSWVDTDAEISANWTLPSDDEKVVFQMAGGAADLGWGWPLYVVSQYGEFKEYHSYIVISTAMTAIGNAKFNNYGWNKLNDGTLYTEVAYYYDVTARMGPQYPSKGSKLSFTIDIPIDATAATASTEYLFKVWAIDCQPESDVAVGATTTSLPTAYGMVTAYGPGALIQASAYTTSSGAGSGRILQVYLTTAA